MSDKGYVEKSTRAEAEEKILEFWKEHDIFKKSLEKGSPRGEFIFYEGPPTANGKPGVHHLITRAFKDVVLRYKTMKGYHVRRKGGWDTHGLPVELQVEKQLGLSSKKEIEEYGVAEFNKKCKESVWEYVTLWEKFTDRIGYWLDKDDPYVTYETPYIESVWNILNHVHEEGLLYKDYKVVPWCPRCGTALSSHELAQGYKDVKDLSVYAKFKIKDFDGAYFLAWTTTPWTLPGNVALAVGKDIDYVEVKVGKEILVLAEEKLSLIDEKYEIIARHKGSEMVGMEYEPLYDALSKQETLPHKENAFKIYEADFVNTEDGTGIVHTAVMYGQDDFELGTKVGLPKYHLVKENGHFVDELGFLGGRFVKDEDVAVDIIKDLAHRGLLFKKEKYEHSYPHCWRCKTPLIYYARDSWYIEMSRLRDTLVKENENINWEPSHIKEGRFGEWLRDVKDWAISRERYWGTPLPLWQKQTGEYVAIGSLEDLKQHTKSSGNTYMVMRHGEADHNIKRIISNSNDGSVHLTENGKEQVKVRAGELKDQVDVIITSPFTRCKETTEIIKKELGLDDDQVVVDERLAELNVGELNGLTLTEFYAHFKNTEERFTKHVEGAETLIDLHKRVAGFMYEIDREYSGKKILLISHQATITALHTLSLAVTRKDMVRIKEDKAYRPEPSELRELYFWRAPRNDEWEIDLHKPFIDEVELVDEDGARLIRTNEVIDVWFDSGAMPFAQDHYPFENKEWIDGKGYPADFISEAIDQTRGWFYTLHAVGALMGKGQAFKNVICLGLILDEHGKKMSKSVGNIVDPWEASSRYGVDPIRLWMYSVNQPGEAKSFDEKSIDEVIKKVFNLVSNTYSFYELYKDQNIGQDSSSDHVLDRWIISRLYTMLREGERYLDAYKIFEASRLIRDFVNDLSTWYLRRSRDRFKGEDLEDKRQALATLQFVLHHLILYMAPFTPFFAEDTYQKMRRDGDKESIHLLSWPEVKNYEVDEKLLSEMDRVRDIVSEALRVRSEADIKVRQPLASLTIEDNLSDDLLSLIKDEVNVKEIRVGEKLSLDTHITEELKQEGMVRDIIRLIQDERKKKDFVPSDMVEAYVDAGETVKHLIENFAEEIQKETGLKSIAFKTLSVEKRTIDGEEVGIELEK